MKTLIAYTGKLGSGKDYQAMQNLAGLKDSGNTIYFISFADPIKKIIKDSFGFTKIGKLKEEFPPFSKLYVKHKIIDSLAELIKDLGYEKYSFVSENHLKSSIARNYEIYEDEFYKHICGAELGIDYSFDLRKLMQILGTELARNVVDTIWIDIALTKITKVFQSRLADYAFVADCRFVNEYTAIMHTFREKTPYNSILYGVVASDETRAKRRGVTLEELKIYDNHGSETSIDEIIALLPERNIIIND